MSLIGYKTWKKGELNVNALTHVKMQNALHLITENKRLQTKEKMSQEELNLKLARALIYAARILIIIIIIIFISEFCLSFLFCNQNIICQLL